jgi:hypothetical protein
MQATPNANTAQKRHKQRALGVALPKAISKHLQSGDIVGPIIAKGDFISHKTVNRTDPFKRCDDGSISILDQFCYWLSVKIQQSGRGQ